MACLPATQLPAGLTHYKSTPIFSEATIPAALRSDHSTKSGVWGRIRIFGGQLRYCVTDSRRITTSVELTPDSPLAIVEPTILHRVEVVGDVTFQVEFWRKV